MKLPSNSKFQRWKYLEAARVIPEVGDVIRVQEGPKGNRKPVIFEWNEIEEFRTRYNNFGLYTSVFQYDNKDLNEATRLGSLYFDLDSPGGEVAFEEAKALYNYLVEFIPADAIRVYFTGYKGFHIECEALALGIGPKHDLADHFRYIANCIKDKLSLTSIDFAVYDIRRMWRLPNSQHQKTNLFKVELPKESFLSWNLDEIKDFAKEPHPDTVPEQVFSATANEWYREWAYQRETTKSLSNEERIARFEKYGSTLIRQEDPDSELVFDPVSLFEGCPSILKMWDEVERTHDLSHEARLFLCSILTYTKEAEWYLHQILSNCDDYNPEKSQSHVADWIRRRELGIGGRPYTCQRANSAGVGCGSCDLEPLEKYDRINGQLIKTGEMAQPSPYRLAYHRVKRSTNE